MFRFLWVQNGTLVDSDRFRDNFREVVERYVGTCPNPRTWRHMATAISREYMLPHLLEEGATTSSDIAQHHSSTISRHHYARNGGDIPVMTTDAVCEQRAAGHAWHNILGTGANPPPLPVRLLRKASSSTFDLGQLQALVKLGVEEALSSVGVTGVSQAQQPSESQALAALAAISSVGVTGVNRAQQPSESQALAPHVAIEREVSLPAPPTPPSAQRNFVHSPPPARDQSSPRPPSLPWTSLLPDVLSPIQRGTPPLPCLPRSSL